MQNRQHTLPGSELLTFFLTFFFFFSFIFCLQRGKTLVTRIPSESYAYFKLISYSFNFSISQQGVSTIPCITTILKQLPQSQHFYYSLLSKQHIFLRVERLCFPQKILNQKDGDKRKQKRKRDLYSLVYLVQTAEGGKLNS